MEVKDVNFKRFVADEGMALRWKTMVSRFGESAPVESYTYAPKEAVIDINNVIGKVEEITMEQYEGETKHCCYELSIVR